MRSILQVGEVVSGEKSAYRLVYQIGEGGMGEVWEAMDLRWSYHVAIKFMRDDSPTLRMRFRREANVLRTLSHPNIVRLIDDGETPDGRPFLVLELLTGQTLYTFLRKHGPLPIRVALQITQHIARALAAAHAAGIVHRDLKPANIFLQSSITTNEHPASSTSVRETNEHHADVVVFDFGIARDLGSSTDAQATTTSTSTTVGTILGSYGYMSPEQLRGGAVDRRADIWALGLVLFEMIEGTGLFYGTREQMIRQVLTAQLNPIPWRTKSVPKEVELIIASCLERDLSRRTTYAQEIEQRLTQLLESNALLPPHKDVSPESTVMMSPRIVQPAQAERPIEAASASNAIYPQVLTTPELTPTPNKLVDERFALMQRQMWIATTVAGISVASTLAMVVSVKLSVPGPTTFQQVVQSGEVHPSTAAQPPPPLAKEPQPAAVEVVRPSLCKCASTPKSEPQYVPKKADENGGGTKKDAPNPEGNVEHAEDDSQQK